MSRKRLWAAAAAVGSLALAAPAAALADGPSAIGQDSNGVSYVGYAVGGSISEYDSNGNPTGSWGTAGASLGQLGGVVAVSVDPSNNVWVLDTNRHVEEFSATGTYKTGFTLPACASGVTPSATTYGGLAVTASNVYVGHPCASTLLRYSLTGTLQQTQNLPGRPRGVAVGPAGSKTNQVFVALPDQSEVLTYDGATFATSSSEPPLNVTGSGSTAWTPTAVVDKNDSGGDELVVADSQNNYIYVYDPGHLYGPGGTYSNYRTLGHGAGASAGSFNDITAMAIHANDGSGLDSNLFIADYNNQRIQRSNDSGYTWWTAAANGPNAGGGGGTTSAPTNPVNPTVTGDTSAGGTLTCNPGTWTGSPTFTYQWRRDGVPIAPAAGIAPTYTTSINDVGHQFTCQVTGTNSAGSAGPDPASNNPTITQPSNLPVGVTINNGAIYTNSTSVTVDVVPPTGTTQVTLSNDGSFAHATTFNVAASGQYSWSLQSAGTERLPKVVYVRFTAPNVSAFDTLSDDIILDTTAPTTSAATARASYRTETVRVAAVRADAARATTKTIKVRNGWTLAVKARDTISGVAKMQYASSTRSRKITTVRYSKSLHLASLKSAKYIRVIDRAGNYGKWVKVKH